MSDIYSYIRKNFTGERPAMTYFWSESITLIRPANISGKKPKDVFKNTTLSIVDLKELNFPHLYYLSIGNHHFSLHLSFNDTLNLMCVTTVFIQIISIVLFQSLATLHFPLFSHLECKQEHPSTPNTFPSLVLV